MDAVFAPASTDAAIISEMAWVLIAGASLIFGGVMLLMGLSLRRDGRHGRRGGSTGARSVRPGLWILGGGLLLPLAVLSALMAYNVARNFQLDTLAAPKPRSRKRTYAYVLRSMRTLRFLLVARAGRLTRIGGRNVLRLSKNPATDRLYTRVQNALAA